MTPKNKKLKNLIIESISLDENRKQIYLELIDKLPKNVLEDLSEIFELEKAEMEKVEQEYLTQLSQINVKYMEKMEQAVKKGISGAVSSVEVTEKAEAEKLLEKLDQI